MHTTALLLTHRKQPFTRQCNASPQWQRITLLLDQHMANLLAPDLEPVIFAILLCPGALQSSSRRSEPSSSSNTRRTRHVSKPHSTQHPFQPHQAGRQHYIHTHRASAVCAKPSGVPAWRCGGARWVAVGAYVQVCALIQPGCKAGNLPVMQRLQKHNLLFC